MSAKIRQREPKLEQNFLFEVGYVGFTYGAGTVGANATCAAGTYDGPSDTTTFVCDVSSLLTAERTVHDISSTNIAVAMRMASSLPGRALYLKAMRCSPSPVDAGASTA